MSIHPLSAGAGYQYLLRHTASGDVERLAGTPLTAYYTASGYPPGRWAGSGLAGLAVTYGSVIEPLTAKSAASTSPLGALDGSVGLAIAALFASRARPAWFGMSVPSSARSSCVRSTVPRSVSAMAGPIATQSLSVTTPDRCVNVVPSWAIGTPMYTMGNMLVPPNPKTPNCSISSGNNNNDPGVYGLSSRHPGGANVLMGDGSVKFLKDSTNVVTIWALGSRSASEVIDASSY